MQARPSIIRGRVLTIGTDTVVELLNTAGVGQTVRLCTNSLKGALLNADRAGRRKGLRTALGHAGRLVRA